MVMVAEWLFRILFGFRGNARADAMFNHRSTEEESMKKFGLIIAALPKDKRCVNPGFAPEWD